MRISFGCLGGGLVASFTLPVVAGRCLRRDEWFEFSEFIHGMRGRTGVRVPKSGSPLLRESAKLSLEAVFLLIDAVKLPVGGGIVLKAGLELVLPVNPSSSPSSIPKSLQMRCTAC